MNSLKNFGNILVKDSYSQCPVVDITWYFLNLKREVRALPEKHLPKSIRLRIRLEYREKIVNFSTSSRINLNFFEGLSDQGLFSGRSEMRLKVKLFKSQRNIELYYQCRDEYQKN